MVIVDSGAAVFVLNRLDKVWEDRPDAVRYVFDASAVSPDVLVEVSKKTSDALAREFGAPPFRPNRTASGEVAELGDSPGHPFRGNQWTDGAGGGGPGTDGSPSFREGSGTGTKSDPLHLSSAKEALAAIGEGKHVYMQPDKVSLLIDKLAANVQEAKTLGKEAPNYNLCNVTVADSNLFCEESQGISRIEMPQLAGKPLPGSEAAGLEKDSRGDVNVAPVFQERLRSAGITMTETTVPATMLKATQNELIGPKVAAMVADYDSGKYTAGSGPPIFVSSDNYVLDGHHRWAAVVGKDYDDARGGDINMNVIKVDMPIDQLLPYAINFTRDIGIEQKGVK